MLEARLFLPKASPISSIGFEALALLLIVTTMLMFALQAAGASVAPAGNAILVVFESGDGAEDDHVADNGAVERGSVVYRVPAGKLCPDFNTVCAGIGATI